MGFNKNFVVKNGLEVNTSLILADAVGNKVGIATTNPLSTLDVKGTINAEDIAVTGVGTFPLVDATNASIDNGYINVGIITNLSGSTLSFSGIGTLGSLYIGANSVVSSARQLQNIASLDATTLATIEAAIADSPNEFTNLIVTGVSTLGIVTGATYYGDGSNLSGVKIGVQTSGNAVGYGVTLIDFRGPGVSTGFYDTASGIATIFFQGGGGSGGAGAIGIGSTFPGSTYSTAAEPQNGDLFYHIDYGRTFIYYDEAALGVGISTYWVDSSPYNLTGNFLEKTGDSMQAGLGITAGTASAPGVFFTNATTTGVFSPVAGETTVVSVGNTILNVNPNGAIVTGVLTATTVSATTASFSGNVSVGGTLTYEDVTNVDSVGLITARTGINIVGGGLTVSGISTFASTVFIGSGGSAGAATTDYSEVAITGQSPSSFNQTYTRAATGFVLDTGTVASGNALFHADSNYYYYVASTGTDPEDRIIIWSVEDNSWLTVFDFNDPDFSEGNITNNQALGSSGIFSDALTANSITADGRSVPQASSDIVYATSSGGGGAGIGVTITPTGNAILAGIVTASSIVVGSAVTANSSGIVVTGVATATDFNSTSDERLKENITTVENAVEVNNQLRGVRFEWKRDGRPSYGVIAQELEQVLPELVSDTDPKTVNYNGIIGVLIEAVKELSARVDELENR